MFKRILIALCALLLSSACSAQMADTAAPYTEGLDYVTLNPVKPYVADGKVEVVEVFSYGCIHCAHFAEWAEKLRKSLPKGVSFRLLPANFSREWEPFARAFYAARELGVVDKTHLALFKAKFEQHYPLNSLDDLANFYAQHGVNRAAFLRAAHSPATDKALVNDTRLIQQWRVDSTPTIVVDGKYRSNHIRNFQQLVDMTKWLVQRELKARQ